MHQKDEIVMNRNSAAYVLSALSLNQLFMYQKYNHI